MPDISTHPISGKMLKVSSLTVGDYASDLSSVEKPPLHLLLGLLPSDADCVARSLEMRTGENFFSAEDHVDYYKDGAESAIYSRAIGRAQCLYNHLLKPGASFFATWASEGLCSIRSSLAAAFSRNRLTRSAGNFFSPAVLCFLLKEVEDEEEVVIVADLFMGQYCLLRCSRLPPGGGRDLCIDLSEAPCVCNRSTGIV